MAIESYLNEVQVIIKLLQEGERSTANIHIQQATSLLHHVLPNDPLRDDCIIINTMIRDYWNGIPAIDIEDIEKECQRVLDALECSVKFKQKESGI
jgi:hypothetical protein